MPVSSVHAEINQRVAVLTKPSSNRTDFSASLKLMEAKSDNKQSARTDSLIALGEINERTPTVSHILKNNPTFTNDCWQIINSSMNSDKDYGKMQLGTKVFYNPDGGQLSWGKDSDKLAAEKVSVPLNVAEIGARSEPTVMPQKIGVISTNKPTVSHLFSENKKITGNYWNIINSSINAQKDYRNLRPGTEVWLDPANNEINFSKPSLVKTTRSGDEMSTLAVKTNMAPSKIALPTNDFVPPASETINLHESFADAVKPFIGIPYDKINCYGLLARGIANQGINYQGRGGVREHLETAAIQRNLPANAYLTGEGLVEQAGTKLYSKAINSIHNVRRSSDEIFSEMLPTLERGDVLSFSTPTKGHTGVVSKKGDQWTYINSGLIDNQVTPGRISRRVGEELLQAEVKNWCELAANRKESLTVTLGRLDQTKLRSLTDINSRDLAVSMKL